MKSIFLRKTIFTAFFVLLGTALMAEEILVSGVIRDKQNADPLIGVNVLVKGLGTGTTTDFDGNYSIKVDANAELVFKYIGYETLTIGVNGQAMIDVEMNSDTQNLDELVVTGYVAQKRRDVLGAVSKLGSDELGRVPVATAQQALQGRVAGVSVSSATGAPGSGVSVRIRGVGSVSSSNDPLYIVDGIPAEDALNTISPSDIENITVLKDASSAAIYGSRANNGVVLITTRKGKAGEAKVTYNGQFGVQNHGPLTEMVNTQDYISIYNEATATDNASSIVKRPFLEGILLKDFADVDHLASVFQTAPIQQHEISISGGTDKINYLVSGSYFNQEGIIKGSSHDKGTFFSNVNAQAKKWLHVGAMINGGVSTTNSIPSSGDGYGNSEGGSVVRYAYFRNPAIPIYDANGVFVDKPSEYYGNAVYDSFFGDGYNPVGITEHTNRERKEYSLMAKGNVKILFPKSITWNTNIGLNYLGGNYSVFNENWGTAGRINNPNSKSVQKYNNVGWSVNSVLDYRVCIADVHNLSAMVGMEMIRNTSHTLIGSDKSFSDTNPNLTFINNGLGVKNVSESAYDFSLMSFFGSINYDYQNRYYVSATIREDGSSRFADGNKWGTFYSASAGWNLESEGFMEDVREVNKLKIRAGWGSIGNQNIGLYAYSDRYSPNYDYAFGGAILEGYVQSSLGNTDLKWETSNQLNVGIDLEMFKGEFGVTVDYFRKTTSDMLVQAPLPPSVGNASPSWINSGKVLNTGVDLEIFYRKDYKNGGFSINLNGGYLYNEVLEIDAPIYGGRVEAGIYATKTEVGHPIGSFYMYEMEGIFQNKGEILTSAYQGKGVQPGDVKYKDINGDNKLDNNDRTHVGTSIAPFTAGLNLSAYFYGIDISAFFQGAFGHQMYSQIRQDTEGFYRGFPTTQAYFEGHWTPDNPSNTMPRAAWSAKSNNVRVSTRFLEDASYVRLKNLQVGYTIPFKEGFKAIEKLRIYLGATNLFTITGYSGLDPEMTVSANSSAEGDRASNIDWGTYPVAKSYTFGINLTF